MLNKQNKNVTKTRRNNTAAASWTGGLFNLGQGALQMFGKRKTKELPPLFTDAELDGSTYEQVIDFLVGINKSDFDKVIKVAQLQRKAHTDMAKVTGMPMDEPQSIFDLQTIEARAAAHRETDTEAGDFLSDDDDLAHAFLDDEPKTAAAPAGSPTGKATKVEVKTDDDRKAS